MYVSKSKQPKVRFLVHIGKANKWSNRQPRWNESIIGDSKKSLCFNGLSLQGKLIWLSMNPKMCLICLLRFLEINIRSQKRGMVIKLRRSQEWRSVFSKWASMLNPCRYRGYLSRQDAIWSEKNGNIQESIMEAWNGRDIDGEMLVFCAELS